MAALKPGETLVVLATDPEAPIDLGAWAAVEGHAFSSRALAGFGEYSLVKAGATPGPPRASAGTPP